MSDEKKDLSMPAEDKPDGQTPEQTVDEDKKDTNTLRVRRARVHTPYRMDRKRSPREEAPKRERPRSAGPFDPREQQDPARDLPDVLPVVALRDVVLFNFMILPLFITRDRSVAAIETTVNGPHFVLALTQKNEEDDDPAENDLYTTGTVVQVLRILKMPDNRIKALVQGVARARVRKLTTTGPYLKAEVDYVTEPEVEHDATVEAMLRVARELCEKVMALRGVTSPELVKLLQSVDEPGRLADLVAANLRMKTDEAQKLLEIPDPVEREAAERGLRYQGIAAAQKMSDVSVDYVFIGSCTNARLPDLVAAAEVLKGRRLAPGVKGMVVPGSMRTRRDAEALGLDVVFKDAGFEWRKPGCSLCLAMNEDVLESGVRCAATTNRNFEGRMGRGSRTHLVSPETAAASGVLGRFGTAEELDRLMPRTND